MTIEPFRADKPGSVSGTDRDRRVYPSLRALRRALVVSDMRHLTHAAAALRRSQSAITRSIVGLEQFLNVQLFERTVTGVVETPAGAVLFRRVRAAIEQMALAEIELLAKTSAASKSAPHAQSFLHFEVSNANVFLFLAVCDHRDFRRAALAQDVALSTSRKSIHALEHQTGLTLFQREPRGEVRPTQFGETLAKYTKRALWEIRAGLDELKSLDGQTAGEVRIGVMSTARSFLVPRAVDRLHRRHPKVLVSVYWANYKDLKLALSCGDIDFIVGALREEELESQDHQTSVVARDRIEVVARAKHPLCDGKGVSLRRVLSHDWILPPPYFPLRIWFRKLLRRKGLPEPKPFIETASLAILRGTLLECDCLALSTQLQCWHDTMEHGLLRALPVQEIDLFQDRIPFDLHLTKRIDAMLSPAAEALYSIVAEVAEELSTMPSFRDAPSAMTRSPG